MSFTRIEYKDKSIDANILNNSARIVSEFINEENQRGESANNRANFAIGIVGIYASILLGLQDFFGLFKNEINSIAKLLLICAIVLLISTLLNALKVVKVVQKEKLSPDMINDIQGMFDIQALQYEIKWKMWALNNYNEENTKKLFYLQRAHRNLITGIIYILAAVLALYFNTSIINWEIQYSWLNSLELVLGIINIGLCLIINRIIEYFSFWNKR